MAGHALMDIYPWAMTAAFLTLRVGAIVGLAPVFGEQTIPMRLRLMAVLGFVLCLLPLMPDYVSAGGSLTLSMAAAECVTGLCFGMLLRLMVLGLQMAGSIIAQVMSLSQIAGAGVGADPAPAIGNLLTAGGLALAATGGLHLQVLNYLLQSYLLVPIGEWPMAESMGMAGLSVVVQATSHAFSLALPFVALALFYNVLLGVMNRAMPQMMVVFIGAPLIVGISLLVLGLLTPVILHLWRDTLQSLLAAPGNLL